MNTREVVALGRADGWRATSVYGAAHFGKSLFWYGGEVLFAYFLTEMAGLAPAKMGLVLGAGFLISAALDLLIGCGLSARLVDARAASALQALGAVAGAVALLAFVATPWLPEAARLPWALAAGVLFRLTFALYDVPQNALMTLASRSGADRSRVAVMRITASGLATLLVAAAVGPLLARSGREGAHLLLVLTFVAAAIAIVSAVLLWRLLRRAQGGAAAPMAAERRPAEGAHRLWPLFAMMAVMMLGPPLFLKLEPYFASLALRSPGWGGAIILAAAIGVLSGQPVWLRIREEPGRRRLFWTAAAFQGAGGLLFLAAPLEWPALLVVAAWLFGVGNGGLGAAKWASFSDAVAEMPPGREGACFAAFSATAKVALAFGVALVALSVELSATHPDLLRAPMAAGAAGAAAIMVLLALAHARPAAAATERGAAAAERA